MKVNNGVQFKPHKILPYPNYTYSRSPSVKPKFQMSKNALMIAMIFLETNTLTLIPQHHNPLI